MERRSWSIALLTETQAHQYWRRSAVEDVAARGDARAHQLTVTQSTGGTMLTRTLALGCAVLLGIAGSTQGQAPQPPAAGAKLELSSASEAAKAEFWAGLEDWQNFTFSSAQKHFERAASLDPNFGLARAFAAAAPAINGLPVATAEFDRGMVDAARASTAEGVLALAWREKAFGRNAAATSLFRAAMDLMPNEPRIASEYIWSLATSDGKAALEAGKAARTKFPSSGSVALAVTYALLQTGDTAAAVAEAQRYTQVAPTQPASFATYGDLLRLQGRYDEAEAQYRRSLTFAPKHPDGGNDAVIGLASLLVQRGRVAAARQTISEAVQHATSAEDSLSYMDVLGGASLYASDVPGAIAIYQTSTRFNGRGSNGLGTFVPTFKLALINATYGDRKSVSKYLAPIHVLAPGDSTQVEMWRGVAYGYAGQADSTSKYADKLAARASNNPVAGRVAHFARGQLYLTTRQCDKALDEFRQSDSTWVEVQAGSADCAMQMGNRAAAMRYRDLVVNRHDVNLYDPGEIRARLRMAQLR
jgi:tetratricopeptide (TPR) repeat protein